MTELIIFILTTTGVSFIISQEFIFEGFREMWEKCFSFSDKLKYLISCPVCLGWWIGLVFSFLPFFNIHYLCAPFITAISCKIILLFEKPL